MNLLFTGGAGCIGTNLVAYLLQRDDDDRIRVLDNLCTGDRRYGSAHLEIGRFLIPPPAIQHNRSSACGTSTMARHGSVHPPLIR